LSKRLTAGDKSTAIEAVISLASGDPSRETHISQLSFIARVYKTLVQGGHYNAKEHSLRGIRFLKQLTIVVDPGLDFGRKLYSAIQPHIIPWSIGEGSFVIVALSEALSGKDRDELISRLKRNKDTLKTKGGQNKGTKILLEKITSG